MDRFAIDTHKLAFHPDRVAQLVSAGRDWDKHRKLKPIYVEISTSGACNHRCTFCSVDYIGYKSVFLDLDIYSRFASTASSIGVKSVMFAGDGEPLLNPHINEIVNISKASNIDVSFTTNGVHLNSKFITSSLSKVSWVKVSINAGDSSTYEKVHRTKSSDFNTVWTNLSAAVQFRRNHQLPSDSPALGVQSLLLPDNIDSLPELARRARDTGLDYLVLKPYVHNVYMEQEGYGDIDYTEKQYNDIIARLKSDYETPSFSIVARFNALAKLKGEEERYSTCWSTPALWSYISGDGSVYACGAHVGNPNFLLGNINQSGFDEIWQSDERCACLNFVQDELDLNDCRRTCRMDEANKYLFDIIEQNVPHKNFI